MQTVATPEKTKSSPAIALQKNKHTSFFAPVQIQPQLSIGAVDDPYEREADAMADRVMRMPDTKTKPTFFQPTPVTVTPLQRKCASCEEEDKLQRKEKEEEEEPVQLKPAKEFDLQRKCASCEDEKEKKVQMKSVGDASGGMSAPPIVHEVINNGGQPLDAGTRGFMESRFGYDFGNVQIHNDSLANQSAKDINALAYTHGDHVVFGAGQYQPETYSGKQLLAHELTHVVQQSRKQSRPIVQRDITATVEEEPLFKIESNHGVDYFKEAERFSRAMMAMVIVNGILFLYDKAKKTVVRTSSIQISDQSIIDFHRTAFMEISYRTVDYLVFNFNTMRYEIDINWFYTTDKYDTPFSSENLNTKYFGVKSWFSDTAELTEFRSIVGGRPTILLIEIPAERIISETVEEEKIPPVPKWMKDFKRELQGYVDNTKSEDIVSVDLPDSIDLHYFKNEKHWQIRGKKVDTNGKVYRAFIDVKQGDTKEELLEKVRKGIRKEMAMADLNKMLVDGEKQAVNSNFVWAQKIITELRLLIKAALKTSYRGSNVYVPDELFISSKTENPDDAYLTISVFAEGEATADDLVSVAKDIERLKQLDATETPEYTPIKTTSIVRKTVTLRDPLEKNRDAKAYAAELFPVVKEYSKLLRYPQQIKDPDEYSTEEWERIIAPFPAEIVGFDVRNDYQTVAGGSHVFQMEIDISSERKDPMAWTVFFNAINYKWRIYSLPELYSNNLARYNSLSSDWFTRRMQIILDFADKRKEQLVAKPLLNVAVMKDITDLREKGLLSDEKKYNSYYGDSGLDDEGEFTLPGEPGDYMIYCQAQWEPFGNTYPMASQAFYPIRLRPGNEFADEQFTKFDVANNAEVLALEQSLEKAVTEAEKDEIRKKISSLTSRSLRDLTDPVGQSNTVTAVEASVKYAEIFKQIYPGIYEESKGDKLVIEGRLEDMEDGEIFVGLYRALVKLPGYVPENIQKFIDKQKSVIIGLKDLHERITEFDDDIDYSRPIYSPTVIFMSDETAKEYPLVTILGYEKGTLAPTAARVVLIDVSTEDTQKKYYSDNFLTAESTEEDFITAAKQAFEDFASTCKYGEGFVRYNVHGFPGLSGSIRGKCSSAQKAKNFLGKLLMVVGIIAFVTGTIASAGVLGTIAAGVGMLMATVGAGLAIEKIADKIENHNLKVNIELALDILSIVAPFAMAAAGTVKMLKMAGAAEGMEDVANLLRLEKLVKLEDGIALYQKVDTGVNLVLTNVQLLDDLAKLDAMIKNKEISAGQGRVLKREVLLNGMLANMMFVSSLMHPESAENTAINEEIRSRADLAAYREANIRSGVFDIDGRLNPKLKLNPHSTSTADKPPQLSGIETKRSALHETGQLKPPIDKRSSGQPAKKPTSAASELPGKTTHVLDLPKGKPDADSTTAIAAGIPEAHAPEKLTADSVISHAPEETVNKAKSGPLNEGDIIDLPPGSVMQAAIPDEAGAQTMYNNSIEARPDLEVGRYRNSKTNEFIVIQGDAGTVFVEGAGGKPEGPAGGGHVQDWKVILDGIDEGSWELQSHYHPVDTGGIVNPVNRMPSGANGDFGVLIQESANAGKVKRSSTIDFKTQKGYENTTFSYDPAAEKPFTIEYPDPITDVKTLLSFRDLSEYHDWMKQNYNVDLGVIAGESLQIRSASTTPDTANTIDPQNISDTKTKGTDDQNVRDKPVVKPATEGGKDYTSGTDITSQESKSKQRIFKPGDPDYFSEMKVGETRFYEDLNKTVGKATRLNADVYQIQVLLTYEVPIRGDFQTKGLPRPENLPSGQNGFEALHPIGPIAGHEAAYGFLFGPFKLNRVLMEHGVESFIRDFGKPKEGVTFTLRVTVERYLGNTYRGVEFLNDIRYEIFATGAEISEPSLLFRSEILVNKPDDPSSSYEKGGYLNPDIDSYLKDHAKTNTAAKSGVKQKEGDVSIDIGKSLIDNVKGLTDQLRSIASYDSRWIASRLYTKILQDSIGNRRPEFVTHDMIQNVKDDVNGIKNIFPEFEILFQQIEEIQVY